MFQVLVTSLLWGLVLSATLPPMEKVVCGKPKNPMRQIQRIVGGLVDFHNSFPWQGLLSNGKDQFSGATLISDQWLLTTGYNLKLNFTMNETVEDVLPRLELHLGETWAFETGRNDDNVDIVPVLKFFLKQPSQIEKIVLHPGFPESVDLALIKLKAKETIGDKIMPICLPKKGDLEIGRVGYVSGWGTGNNGRYSAVRKYVPLPVANQTECEEYYQDSSVFNKPDVNENVFCAGLSEYEEDTCFGDAGGAFAIHDQKRDTWYAAGILSFDRSCAVRKYGVYMKVSSFLDWIENTMATE